MTTDCILGIDPGLSGAFALLCPDNVLQVFDMPVTERVVNKKKKRQVDAHGIVGWLELNRYRISKVVIEKVGAMPGQGVTSSFNFGYTAGVIDACCVAAGLKIEHVYPQVWKRKFGLLGQPKDASRAAASKLLPASAYLWPRKKDDGRAEAALLTIYGNLMDTPVNYGGTS